MSGPPAGPKRILSGMRPTGKLHLGHLAGVLDNWVQLQREFDSFHMVADWHVLTTDFQHTETIHESTLEMVTDWLIAGIDPAKSPVFRQSDVKEHAELHLLLSMLITVSRLERNPTVKDQVRDLHLEETVTYGHLGYPVLQAADILLYRAHCVPVGEDQVPHLEITRELARRFNGLYAPVFPEPEARLTRFPRLPGLDGRRMSKSAGNALLLSDPPELIAEKLRGALTDPEKKRRGDPGRPEVCPVFTLWTVFGEPAEVEGVAAGCRTGELGCVADKARLAAVLAERLAPFRDLRRRPEYGPASVEEILRDGARRARAQAQATMDEVRRVMGFGA